MDKNNPSLQRAIFTLKQYLLLIYYTTLNQGVKACQKLFIPHAMSHYAEKIDFTAQQLNLQVKATLISTKAMQN
jgi:hypothetical protein